MLNSPVDIAMVVGVVLLFFGPKKLPELGKALGQGIGHFRKGLQDAQDEMKASMQADNTVVPKAVVADQYGQVAPAGPVTSEDKLVSRETVIKE